MSLNHPPSPAEFLRRLRRLTLDEADSARQQLAQIWSQPLAARVANGDAIEGVQIVRVTPEGVVELACQRNTSRFCEGDVLLLNRGNPLEEPRILCTLEVDDETRLLVSMNESNVNWGRVLHQQMGWALDQGYVDVSQYILDALNQVAETTIGQQRILPLLLGKVEPTIDYARYERAYERAEQWGLNEAQCEAVASAYATNLTWLIQGPPGTGKTLALARLVQLLVEDGERVFVTALTHRAVNNALEKIADLNRRGDAAPVAFCKIGRQARAKGLNGVKNYETFDQSPLMKCRGGYAIGATPLATRTKRLRGVEFDTVIFDEASQITMPLAIMGMLVAKRYIFIGDYKQLPPVLTAKHREAWLRSSVFGALVGRRFDTMLDQTYRMNTELTEWPSRQHYYGKLHCATEAIARRRIVYQRPPTRFIDILDPETPKVFVDLRHRNTTTSSREEATLICDLIPELLRCGVEPAEIGVIAPYRAQGRLVRNLLRSVIPDDNQRQAIVVDTVERMQGQEREVVLLSLTTSNPAFAAGIADFFLQPERLNVAVTRARVKLIIVGSRHLLSTAPDNREYRALVEQLKNLISSCAYRSAPTCGSTCEEQCAFVVRVQPMAAMFPEKPAGMLPPETVKVFQLLKRSLPDDDYAVWQRLVVSGAPEPDFLVRHCSGRFLIIKVSTATPQDAQNALQGELFDERVVFGSVEREALQRFWSELGARAGAPSPVQVPGVILFPNISSNELRRALPPGIRAAGREDISPERLPAWVEAHLGTPLTRDQIDALRAVFSPEVVIPATVTVRQPLRRGTSAGLTDHLLSPTQEWALKVDLELSDEADAASRDMRVWQVSGVAGSGKSLLIVYRARLLRQYFPKKRILVLTFNRPLIRDLEARYKRLTDGDTAVEWKTFHKWCRDYWPQDEEWSDIIHEPERASIIADVWRQHLADTSISERMLREEIDWFKDRLLSTRQDYLSADRSGRGFGLNEAMRNRMYDAMLAYQRQLRAKGLFDWGDVPRRVWRALIEDRVSFQPYDFILIDEAQFFAPIWFEIIRLILNPKGHLFVVADPTQGFLRRGQSWKTLGLEVRGRSVRLDRSYRTTPAILDFASRMYQMRLPGDEEAIIARAASQAHSEPPQIIALDSEQDEMTRVVNEIRALHERGVPLEHILVLHPDWQGVERMLERLQREFGSAKIADPKKIPPGKHLRVCTMNAATGLESPIVFVMGVHRLYEAEQNPRLSEEERAEMIRDNTRQLYMAFTRAGQRLAITCVGNPPPFLPAAA